MQTTLRFPDAFMREVKAAAAKEGITLTEFFRGAAEMRLHPKPAVKKKKIELPVFHSPKPFNLTPAQIKALDCRIQDEKILRSLGVTDFPEFPE